MSPGGRSKRIANFATRIRNTQHAIRNTQYAVHDWLAGLIIVLLAALPPILHLDRFHLLTLTFGYLFAGLAISWFLLARAGQISLGHAAFFGLGAYASALSALRLGISPWLGLILGMGAAVLFAALVGVVCFRFRGLYFALATFAAAEVAKALVLNWDSLTYGAQGLVGIPGFSALSLGSLRADFETSRLPNYYVALTFLAMTALLVHWVMQGALGLAFTAVRESEVAAEAVGIDPRRIKMIALLVSAGVTGAGGGVYAHLVHYLEPGLAFSVSVSSLPLVMTLFGGLMSLAGPLVGGLTLYLVDALIFQPLFPTWHQALYGATLILVVLYMPRGLFGWVREQLQHLSRLHRAGSQPQEFRIENSQFTIRNPKLVLSPVEVSENRNGGPLLEVHNLVKRFDGLTAMDDVSIQVGEQEIIGLLGPNGSGKTTLINIIAGRMRPTAGTIHFGGRDITDMPAYARCHLGLARTFQTVKPFDHLTVLDNVATAAVYGGPRRMALAEARQEATRLLAVVGLADKAGDLGGTLSMGQRKRLELARALATQPRLLLADEVGAGLTPADGAALRELLARLRDAGLTILGVEHAPYALADVVDRLITLDQGRVIAEGPPDVVLNTPAVIDAYMGE